MGDVSLASRWNMPRRVGLDGRRVAKLRQRIDVAIVQALADPRFAEDLLNDPASIVAPDWGPEQRAWLGAIRADSVKDFAQQSLALFWPECTSARHNRRDPALTTGTFVCRKLCQRSGVGRYSRCFRTA